MRVVPDNSMLLMADLIMGTGLMELNLRRVTGWPFAKARKKVDVDERTNVFRARNFIWGHDRGRLKIDSAEAFECVKTQRRRGSAERRLRGVAFERPDWRRMVSSENCARFDSWGGGGFNYVGKMARAFE